MAEFCTSMGPTTAVAAVASSEISLMGVTTPTAAGTASMGPATISATGPSANDPTAAPANGTSSSVPSTSKKGLSSSAKAGLGAGLGIGIPLILLAIAAYTLVRMRKGRAARGPYDQVRSGEKGMHESASYSSPRMETHQLHPMSPTVPFLPPGAVLDASSREHQYHDRPTTAHSQHAEYSAVEPVSAVMLRSRDFLSTPQEPMPGQVRPATSRDVSRPATPPSINTSVRPATAQAHYGSAGMDEPPSPISPVSPASPAGSRPASFLNERDHHHDS
ncbi:hypothetical protein LTR78_000874 [Recurvomyces mirabilis]|uniref:Uncharacterized protein n=1 Tax=Recurvomyces mirabilis TaxID=574656 RepID=A0AAE1C5X3_9PEZI|nr:hypothetical protein LTR78_000874 [Recurvomyces mirabilis]KAK5158845.1 hypothetical protein LTS14_002953 [Recurvomyces mirabilis]